MRHRYNPDNDNDNDKTNHNHNKSKNYVHIDTSNKNELEKFKSAVHSKTPIFVLFYLEGCGPCNATRPEWKKIENMSHNYGNAMFFDIDSDLLIDLKSDFPNISNVAGFPTMKFIQGNNKVESYEGGRSIDDFKVWIESKIGKKHTSSLHKKRGGSCGCSNTSIFSKGGGRHRKSKRGKTRKSRYRRRKTYRKH